MEAGAELYIWSSCYCSIIAALCRVAMVPNACVSAWFPRMGARQPVTAAPLCTCLGRFVLAGKWLKRTSNWVFPTPNCPESTVFLSFGRWKTVLRRDKFSTSPPSVVFPQSRLDDMKCGIPSSTKCWGGVMWGREGAAFRLAQACCHQRFFGWLAICIGCEFFSLAQTLFLGIASSLGEQPGSGALYKGSTKQMRPVLPLKQALLLPAPPSHRTLERDLTLRDSQVGQMLFGLQIPAASCTPGWCNVCLWNPCWNLFRSCFVCLFWEWPSNQYACHMMSLNVKNPKPD